jgi:predicted amino acid-binding ACT domain protein
MTHTTWRRIGHRTGQKGVVARISTYLASSDTNIEDIEQRVVEGLFIMTMVIDLADVAVSLDELILGLKQIGTEMHLEVSVRLHGERMRKRIAVLVSREPHCLQQLLTDQVAGAIAGDFVCVLSNHEILRPLAEHADPVQWRSATDDRAGHQTWLPSGCASTGPTWSCWRATCRSSARTGRKRNRIINIRQCCCHTAGCQRLQASVPRGRTRVGTAHLPNSSPGAGFYGTSFTSASARTRRGGEDAPGWRARCCRRQLFTGDQLVVRTRR